MNLRDIYEDGGYAALRELAKKIGADPQYLRQCATGWKGKRPSPEMAAKLIEVDPRITWDDLYKDAVEAAKESVAA